MALNKITVPAEVTQIVEVPPIDNKTTFISTRLTFLNWFRKLVMYLGTYFQQLSPITNAISASPLFEADKFKGSYKEDGSWSVGDFVIDDRGYLFVYADPSSSDAKWHCIDYSKNTLGGFSRKWQIISTDGNTSSSARRSGVGYRNIEENISVNILLKQNSSNKIKAKGYVLKYPGAVASQSDYKEVSHIEETNISGSFIMMSFIVPVDTFYKVVLYDSTDYYYWMELK